LTLLELLDAAAVAARQIATGPLGASDPKWSGASGGPLPKDMCGIYIPLIADGMALQLGVLAAREVCVALGKALLAGTEEPLDSDADLFDAMGEIANLIAGDFKVLLADRVSVRVGLPLALRGRVIPLGGSQSVHGSLNVGGNDVWLGVTGPKMR
jgi:hypothetical protein